MDTRKPEVAVAGHICLDLIPMMEERIGSGETTFAPGKLIKVGPALAAIGGVANTGLALHRLGFGTRMMNKIGDDLFGRAILDLLREQDPALAEGMIQAKGANSSYSMVVSPPGVDRMFLHCPGANDTFSANEVNYDLLDELRLLHFGYPPLMRDMFKDGGDQAASLLSRTKDRGLTTSLDMSTPDPASEAGRIDWEAWLRRVLPNVDVFLPSIDEILFMLDRQRFDRVQKEVGSDVEASVNLGLVRDMAVKLLEMGAAVVAIKLGDQGLFLKTVPDETRLGALGRGRPADPMVWAGRELYTPCFQANLVGTTGSGDCTIAGFLAGLLKGLTPPDTLSAATAVGACSVERADATSGVPRWEEVCTRLESNWVKLDRTADSGEEDWLRDECVWIGPGDKTR